MDIFSWDDLLRKKISKDTALSVGGFDGPHLGHKSLCAGVLKAAREKDLLSGIITFARSPRLFKQREIYAGDVSTLRLRLKTFEDWGFNFAVVIDFSRDFSKMEGIDFLQVLADNCKARFLTVGLGFRCGYQGKTGTAEIEVFTKKHGIDLLIAPLIGDAGKVISSTEIRQAVASGKFKTAAELLGRPFLLDCLAFDWRREQKILSGTEVYSASIFSIKQILPPAGSYHVQVFLYKTVNFDKSDCSMILTFLDMDASNLRLEVPYEYKDCRLDTIGFSFDNLEGKNNKE